MTKVKTIKGIVRGGHVEPTERLNLAEGTEVTINVPGSPSERSQPIKRGLFKGPRETTEDDFKIAECRGDDEGTNGE